MKEVKIDINNSNQRLDKYLLKYFNKAPKSFIYKMLRKKRIKLNAKKAEGSEILTEDDLITMFLTDETMDSFMSERIIAVPTKREIDIIFEDENILILKKPAGVLIHPEKSTDTDTIINRVLYYLHENNEFSTGKDSTFTPSVCNRLDRNTSGVVICGKNLRSVQELNKIFSENKVDKYYLAIVKGEVTKGDTLKGYHIKNTDTNEVKILENYEEGSKEVITIYEPLQSNEQYSLLQIKLVTGKSHQIRAHLQNINHPILGDRKYGDFELNSHFKKKFGINNQLLHAYKIILREDSGILSYLCDREFVAEPTVIFNRVLRGVSLSSN